MPVYRDTLDEMQGDKDNVALRPMCHPEAPIKPIYSNGVLHLLCFECDRVLGSIAVASQEEAQPDPPQVDQGLLAQIQERFRNRRRPLRPWATWCVQAFDETGRPETDYAHLAAPSPGAAVELFLAVHGLTGYSLVKLRRVAREPEEGLTQADLIDLAPGIEEMVARLDEVHSWEDF